MNRKATLSHGNFKLNLPLFFPSISSVKTNFTALEYLKLLKAELENTDSPEEQANLASEITEVEHALENLGEVVALSAIYENLINRNHKFWGNIE